MYWLQYRVSTNKASECEGISNLHANQRVIYTSLPTTTLITNYNLVHRSAVGVPNNIDERKRNEREGKTVRCGDKAREGVMDSDVADGVAVSRTRRVDTEATIPAAATLVHTTPAHLIQVLRLDRPPTENTGQSRRDQTRRVEQGRAHLYAVDARWALCAAGAGAERSHRCGRYVCVSL